MKCSRADSRTARKLIQEVNLDGLCPCLNICVLLLFYVDSGSSFSTADSNAFLIFFFFGGTVINGFADVVTFLFIRGVTRRQGIMTVPGVSQFAKNCPLHISLNGGNDIYGYQETKHHVIRRVQVQCDLCGKVRDESGVMIGASNLW